VKGSLGAAARGGADIDAKGSLAFGADPPEKAAKGSVALPANGIVVAGILLPTIVAVV
jgi:hypothetical protein